MSKKPASRIVLIFGALLLVAPSAWADVSFFSGLEIRYDENIGLAPFSADEESDITTELDLGLNWNIYNAETAQVSLLSSVFYAYVADLSDLSEYGIDVDLAYRGQVSPDFTALWWSVSGQARLMEFNDSDIRDGWSAQAGAQIGKRFNNVFGLSAGGRVETRKQTEDNPENQPPAALYGPDHVFDLDNWAAFLRATFTVGPDTEIFAQYTFRSGDVAATGRSFNNGGQFARAIDYAFEQDPNYIVWRIDADQDILDVGVSQIFTEQFVAEFAVGYLDASGESGNDYDNLYGTLSASFSF